jgi:hypothetical protein
VLCTSSIGIGLAALPVTMLQPCTYSWENAHKVLDRMSSQAANHQAVLPLTLDMFVEMLDGHLQAPGEQPHLAASSPSRTPTPRPRCHLEAVAALQRTSTPSSPPHRCRSGATAARAEDMTHRGRLRCATKLLQFAARHEAGHQPCRRAEADTDRELNRDLRPALHDTKPSRPQSLPASP